MAYIVSKFRSFIGLYKNLWNLALGNIIAYTGAKVSPYDTGSANTLGSTSVTATTGTITTAEAGELIVAMTSAGISIMLLLLMLQLIRQPLLVQRILKLLLLMGHGLNVQIIVQLLVLMEDWLLLMRSDKMQVRQALYRRH